MRFLKVEESQTNYNWSIIETGNDYSMIGPQWNTQNRRLLLCCSETTREILKPNENALYYYKEIC